MLTSSQQNSSLGKGETTKLQILQYLLKHDQVTARELAQVLQISPQAIRRHLKDLEGEELISFVVGQATSGRPQHIYELTAKGQHLFPHSYDQFAIAFLDTLAETVGKDQVSVILQKQWQRKALHYRQSVGNGSLGDRLNNLVALRQAEGYMAECHQTEGEAKQAGYIFIEHNCAISNVAESFPSVCGHELEMFSMVLPDCKVERTHSLVEGEHRCGYLITVN